MNRFCPRIAVLSIPIMEFHYRLYTFSELIQSHILQVGDVVGRRGSLGGNRMVSAIHGVRGPVHVPECR